MFYDVVVGVAAVCWFALCGYGVSDGAMSVTLGRGGGICGFTPSDGAMSVTLGSGGG